MTKTLSTCTLLALLVAAPQPAAAGVIRGTLRVPRLVSPEGHTPPAPAPASPYDHPPHRGLASDAVVYVDHVPARAESALAAVRRPRAKLAQKGMAFVPRVVAIAAGASVDFPNHDPAEHSIFSLSPTRPFDLGTYPRGESRRVEFPKPGLVNVYCDLHSQMEAFILVLPHHGYARPSATGGFRLPELPAGSYVLHVWHPDLGEKSANVRVPATGEVIADLSLQP